MEMKQTHKPCEPKTSDTLYKIGMFAAMNHVTVKTLRFYEEQGLLAPVFIHPETGYRYYTLSQMAVLHQITALKRAGFTLEEIARINAGADEQALLHRKKAALLDRIFELTRQIAVVDSYLCRQHRTLCAPVLVKTLPAVTVAAMSTRISSYDRLFEVMPAMGALMEQAGCSCAMPEYCFTSYPEPGYKEEDILVETCEAVTEAKDPVGGLYFKTLPETSAACIFHKGSYATLAESYGILLQFIAENGWEIAGEIRESYIDGVWNRDEESQWLTEIQIPVREQSE